MLSDQRTLIQSLSRRMKCANARLSVFETHISWVLVTENFAYKIKKAVQYDFLDFSTVDLRHFYCYEELRLNARISPELYLDVVPIVETPDGPAIEVPGVTIEYAVKMRAFSQHAIWNARLQSACLLPSEVDSLAHKLAKFHRHAAVAAEHSIWGSSESIRAGADNNLASIAKLASKRHEKRWADDMRAWQRARQEALSDTFDLRKVLGRIRECHGDLHCGNILTINDQVSVFDCIEFNESFRWIDVMDDIAFACMDLRFQRRPDLAARLLNRYLEISGDYEGLFVFRYYQVERALVRCKVALLRAHQVAKNSQSASLQMALAARYMTFSSESVLPSPVVLVLMHGYSGSGKSVIASCLVEAIGAIQIRSDVERKRIHALPSVSNQVKAPAAGLYDMATTKLTYARLGKLARQVIKSGLSVVVDAACLRQEQRHQFESLARELAIPCFILDVHTGEVIMRARIGARAQLGQDASDASLSTLAHQIATHEEFSDDELKHVIRLDGEISWTKESIRGAAAQIVDALATEKLA